MHPLYYTDGSGSFLPWSPVPGSPPPHFQPPLLSSTGLLSLEAAFSTWHSGFTLCPLAHRYPVPRSEWSHPDVTGELGLGTILLAKFQHRASTSADGSPSQKQPQPPHGRDPGPALSSREPGSAPWEPSSPSVLPQPLHPAPPPASFATHLGCYGASHRLSGSSPSKSILFSTPQRSLVAAV